MIVDPSRLARPEVNALLTGLVAPRPIAWVSTLSPEGERNLAPFSFFNAFSVAPPTLGVAPGSRRGVNKDSLRNIRATGELTISVVTTELAERANLSSAEFGPEVDEWEIAGVDPAPSEDVTPAWVARSPAAFECRVAHIVDLGTERQPTNSLVIARVTRIHVRDDVLEGWDPRPDALELVGRMGGPLWCTVDAFALPRPASVDPDTLRAARR